MRKNLEIPKPLLRSLRMEAVKNDSTVQVLAGEILEHYLDVDVPPASIEGQTVRTEIGVDEMLWESVRQLAHRNGESIYTAFVKSAVALGYAP